MKKNPVLRYPALILLVFVIGRPAPAQNGFWSPKALTLYGSTNDISFADSLYGWAVGDTGRILRTINGGQTWTSQNSNTPNNLFAVSFINRNEGFAAGDLGTIVKTTNGGVTWTASSTTPVVAWERVHFSTSQLGWMISKEASHVYRTTDGGANWDTVGPAVSWTTLDNIDMWFNGPTSGWVAGGSTLLHTSDGQSWSNINTYFFTYLSAVSFPTDSVGYVIKAYFTNASRDTSVVYKTTDAGQSWNPAGGFHFAVYSSAFFVSPSEGWVAGDDVDNNNLLQGGAIRHTTNGGASWTEEAFFDTGNTLSSLSRITFTDRIHGWCAGTSFAIDQRMMIGKYYGIPLSVHELPNTMPDGFVLDQNYPNPFNPSTTIRYAVPSAGHVRLSIFDVTGAEVATLFDGERHAGTFTATWYAAGVASGVYYARVSWSGFSLTRKMLLVR